MPVVGVATTPVILTRAQVRMFMRDRADKNILLDDVQFTDDELNFAMDMAAESFNAVTPQTNILPQSMNKYVLLLGTVKFLLMSESFLQVRNQASYQDGEISPIGIDDKMAQYSQMAQSIKAEWDELVRGIKTQNNMESAYNRLGSGYRNVSRNNR